MLSPYYAAANLTFTEAQKTLALDYKKTLLYWDRLHTETSGLDALAVRQQVPGFPLLAVADPQMPIPAKSFNHLTIDCEGLVLSADGTYVCQNIGEKNEHDINILQILDE